jgi:hypothetical protein
MDDLPNRINVVQAYDYRGTQNRDLYSLLQQLDNRVSRAC